MLSMRQDWPFSANEWVPRARLSSGSAATKAASMTVCSFAVRIPCSLSNRPGR